MTMGEDTLFMYQVCKNANITVATPTKYSYIKNEGSATVANATSKKHESYFEDNIRFYETIIKKAQNIPI